MYCTQQDMTDRFGEDELIQLTDRAGTGLIDATVLDQAIGDASATMDAYIGARYTLPLANVPVTLARICADLARYALYDDAAPDQVTRRHDDAVKFLQAVAAGKVSLGVDASDAPATPADGAEIDSGGRVFSRDDTSFI